MKPESFEEEIRRRKLAGPPEAWRKEILSAANRACGQGEADSGGIRKAIRSLLWPCPQAWAGLAAAWVVIIVVNSAGWDGQTRWQVAKGASPSPELNAAIVEQRRMLAQLIDPAEDAVAEPPKPAVNRPRSEAQAIVRIV
jgi:hypothetical protein